MRSGSELWSLAPAFGPSPVVRPVLPSLRLFWLRFCFPLGEGLAGQPPCLAGLRTAGTGEAGASGPEASPADLALPAGAPQSVQLSHDPPQARRV